jgi:CDGSH-type Zn-finger protein
MSDDSRPKIKGLKNGPFMVTNLSRLLTSEGKSIKTTPEVYLCRCGKSNIRPFCDGTHERAGFTSTKEEGRLPDRVKDYEGKEITIHDNRGACSHAEHCVKELPSVWDMKAKPWIDPNGASVEEIIRVIEMCPSGALSYTKDGVKHDSVERDPSVHLSKDGPYLVVGGVELEDDAGSVPESKEHYTLCRCGAAKNKPFCDGTHWNVDFKHDESDVPLDE